MSRSDGPNRNADKRLEQELDALRAQRDAARQRVRELESSASYRLGSKAVSMIRRLRAIGNRSVTRGRGIMRSDARKASAARPIPFRGESDRTPIPRAARPDVTIVVPVYNSEEWLDDCLSSVLAQSGVDLELICVDDGSTDRSAEILQRFAAADPRVTVIEQPNQGQSVGRNAGLDAATGRYLVYLDSDDFWLENTLESLIASADEQHLDMLMFDSLAFLDGTVADTTWQRYSTYYQRSRSYDAVRTGPQMIADMRRHKDYRPHVGMYLARTALVKQNGIRFIPGIIHQDNPYTFALLLSARKVSHIGAEIYARRIRPGSTITTLQDARSVTGYFQSYLAMTRTLRGQRFSPEVTEKIAEVVYGVFDGASKKVASLSPAEFAAVKEIDDEPDAQIAFQALTRFRR